MATPHDVDQLVEESPETTNETREGGGGLVLVAKKNTISPVWTHFGLKAGPDNKPLTGQENNPICKLCYKPVSCKGGNTTNMFVHLRDNHPTIHNQLVPKSAATKKRKLQDSAAANITLEAVIERSGYFNPSSKQAKEMNKAVAYYLAKDMQPYYTIERPGFKNMISKLCPRYKLPSRKHFSQHEIPSLYAAVKADIISKLQDMTYYSATTDLWTSRSCDPYLCYTVHFVDSAWEVQSFCLETIPLFEDHTGKNIVDTISDIMANWELKSEQLVSTTTDNGSNFVAGFRQHQELWIRLSCFGHCLDLAINKSLAIIRVQRVLARCKSLVAAFHRSWKKQRDLVAKQNQLGIKEQKLIAAVSTRWGSSYDMITRVLEQQQALSAVLAEHRESWHLMPSNDDISVLEMVVEVLKPLSVLTDALSGEKEVTGSALRPVLKHVVETCKSDEKDKPLVAQMKATILEDLSTRYNIPIISPRFKVDHIQDSDLITSELQLELKESEATTSDDQILEVAVSPPPTKKAKGLGAILCKLPKTTTVVAETSLSEQFKREVSTYLGQPCLQADSNPLLWWKMNDKSLPLLSSLARKYLSVPGTSVPSERVFSKGGIIVDPYRNRLKPHHVNVLTFLSRNLK